MFAFSDIAVTALQLNCRRNVVTIWQLFTSIKIISYNRINLAHDLLSHSIINSSHRVGVTCGTRRRCSQRPTNPILLLVLECRSCES
jgi:hypothetical protein